MDVVTFENAESIEPDPGWVRKAVAGGDRVTVEYFEKPPAHSSPMHNHVNAQVCLCLEGELTVSTEAESVRLTSNDSVYLHGGESHRVENTGDDPAIGLDVFAPGRSFDYWTDED